MIIIKQGNILDSTEDIICHQVNEKGIMGGGLALQIAKMYPEVEKEYRDFCKNKDKNDLYGECLLSKTHDNKYIANCFTQKNYITNVNDIEKVFRRLFSKCKEKNLSICIPYKYGCGIAYGDWKKVSDLFEKLSNEYSIELIVYQLN